MTMTSSAIKQIFNAAGFKVRVRDFGLKFRVCTIDSSAVDKVAFTSIASRHGFTNVYGVLGGMTNQKHEFFMYKPGAINVTKK